MSERKIITKDIGNRHHFQAFLYTDARYDIDEFEELIQKERNAGATHLEFRYDSDEEEISIQAVLLRHETQEELEKRDEEERTSKQNSNELRKQIELAEYKRIKEKYKL